MVYEDLSWDFGTWNFEQGLPYTEKKLRRVLDAIDPNLDPFRAHGGKLLIYQGWSDPVVAPLNTVNYYKSVVAALRRNDKSAFEQETPAFFPQQ
jgi:feruloyl esterase